MEVWVQEHVALLLTRQISKGTYCGVLREGACVPGVLALRRAPCAGNFPKSVCTSVNECVCHGIPDARKLMDGDIVNIDVTVYLNVRVPIAAQHSLLFRPALAALSRCRLQGFVS